MRWLVLLLLVCLVGCGPRRGEIEIRDLKLATAEIQVVLRTNPSDGSEALRTHRAYLARAEVARGYLNPDQSDAIRTVARRWDDYARAHDGRNNRYDLRHPEPEKDYQEAVAKIRLAVETLMQSLP